MKEIIKNLPLAKQVLEIKHELALMRHQADRQTRILQELFVQQLINAPKYNNPKHLIHYETQVYSQNGEDGIISEIFNRIGTTNRYFVEVGSSSGLENNTALLLLDGWEGIWFEGEAKACQQAEDHWPDTIRKNRLKIVTVMITAENFQNLLEENKVPGEPDLLSLDIDRNTFHVFEKMTDFRPRLLILEYNGVFPLPSNWGIGYKANEGWDGTHRFGAALKAFEIEARKKKYSLVGCDTTGTNAFFVRNDLVGDHFLEPFTTEFHYEPYRQFLVREMPYPKVPPV
jgi:hypothetical protein